MTALTDVVSSVLMLVGALFCLLAGVGVLRFPDAICRLHAAAKAQTLGVVLILLGTELQVSVKFAWALLLVAVFQLITVPVTGQVVGRTAYRTGEIYRPGLVMDELADRLAADARRESGEPAESAEPREDAQERGND
ncbi:monovalent cation/H(+) antiporter subunit G [Streptomyces johnsoniae]|uniref:Monovalent cation/H(+) antiporter subunit G n=1 Tax=Streptomyces johnsoniae TaxID=3075532 RepID=A0ABU2SDU7_9ACTN|nr:monovalent cation/H(+) antiporter subunit G [Streptomyces sp. DSM 41886]MDT0446973.1 monovalent cation/H(+) antiporter subunit G [Streptomyces sp. DSM 41886]